MTWRILGLAVTFMSFALVQDATHFSESEIRIIAQFQLPDLPTDPTNAYADDSAAAHFGQYLFFETGFSQNQEIACSACHQPALGFADKLSLGKGLAELSRHSQSLWQVAYQRWFFWDGRVDTLWGQALQPIEDPRELGTTRLELIHFIHQNASLREAYEQIFGPLPELNDTERFPKSGRPVPAEPQHPHHQAWLALASADREAVNRAFANVGKALAAYQRLLVSKNSPFDQFANALALDKPLNVPEFSESAQRGLKLFIGKAQCRSCHNGPNFSDGEFHNNGVPPLNGGIPRDPGRWQGIPSLLNEPFNSASAFSDDRFGPKATSLQALVRNSDQWGQFKTPSLRNVAETAPYMHQGQLPTLEAVVAFYADLRDAILAGHHREPLLQPLDLSSQERVDLVAFLKSLTGEPLPTRLLQKPASPLLSQP